MKRLYVDLIEDLRADEEGYRHILVVIDAFSRYLMLYPLKEKTSMAVAKAMLSLVGEYGTPDQIVGPCFISDVCQELFKLLGAEHVLRYTLFNLLTGREKDYHVRRLHEYHYDPQTLNPLLAACKDDGSIYPVDSITKMRGNPEGRKDGLSFLVHWVGFDTPTWEPWGMSADLSLSINTSAVIGMRSVPKNISYQGLANSSDEEEIGEEEGREN